MNKLIIWIMFWFLIIGFVSLPSAFATQQCIRVVDADGLPLTNLNCSMVIDYSSYSMSNDSTKFCYDVTSFAEGNSGFDNPVSSTIELIKISDLD